MRVLHVINSLQTGGAEKLLLDTLPLYNKTDNHVDLLLLNDTACPFLAQLKRQKRCSIFSLGSSSVYNPFLIFKIIPYLKKHELVHVHLFPALYWVALAKVISFSKTPIIYTEHSTHNRRRNKFLFKVIDRFIYNRFIKLVTISDEVDCSIKKHLGFKSSRFQLIHNGVDTAVYAKAKAYPKSEFFSKDDKILIQVSNFTKAKDQQTLIRAIKLLDNSYKLLLVGEGNLMESNQNLVRELGLEERVQFLGIRMDVPKLLKSADIIVLSSHWEGFGLVAVEAMASGLPLIVSDVPGLREIVKGAGLLFAKGDEKELAQHSIELSTDSILYKRVVRKCKERAKLYDISIMVKKHLKLYNDIALKEKAKSKD